MGSMRNFLPLLVALCLGFSSTMGCDEREDTAAGPAESHPTGVVAPAAPQQPNPSPEESPTQAPTPSPAVPVTPPSPVPGTSGLPPRIGFTPQSFLTGTISYHLNLPYGSGNVEELKLSPGFADLLISNFVAGALLGHMIREKAPGLQLNDDYVYGTLFAQLLQENINTAGYSNRGDWINAEPTERAMLLAPGQGGPYQLNDYSKRLETSQGIGLINYVALQKGLGYTVEAQDSGSQTASKGPDALDDKYFGPMAAAFFHLNDMNRMDMNNAESWGPQYAYYSKCMRNLKEASSAQYANNLYDLILNAAYNAGTYSTILEDTFRICAGMYGSAPETTQVASMGDYSLSDTQYQNAIGTREAAGSTFILYPRQIRLYLDQLYNQKSFDSAAIRGNVEVRFSLQDVEYVFQNALGTLAYVNASQSYGYIAPEDSKRAFESALTQQGLSLGGTLNISKSAERKNFFGLLDRALQELESRLGIQFSAVTQTTIGQGGNAGPSGTPSCPSSPPLYPAGRGTYAAGSIVKGTDGKLYTCTVAGWCNSTAEWAYAPGSGSSMKDAWSATACR